MKLINFERLPLESLSVDQKGGTIRHFGSLYIKDLKFDQQNSAFSANWIDSDTGQVSKIVGEMGKVSKRDQSRMVKFTYEEGHNDLITCVG